MEPENEPMVNAADRLPPEVDTFAKFQVWRALEDERMLIELGDLAAGIFACTFDPDEVDAVALADCLIAFIRQKHVGL